MKMSAEARGKLTEAIRHAATQKRLNYAEIGAISAVHPSQVSRICRGDFKTLSANVMQICTALQVPTPQGAASSPDLQSRLERSIVDLWDRTSEDAERLMKLMRQLADIRAHS